LLIAIFAIDVQKSLATDSHVNGPPIVSCGQIVIQACIANLIISD
jgi:hypothetical protein